MSKICFINESLPFLLVVPILLEKKERSVFFNPIAMLSTKCPLPLLRLLTLAAIILILRFL